MINRKTAAIMCSALFLAPVFAFSQEADSSGIFVGTAVGNTYVDGRDYNFSANDLAWKVFGGYRFNENFAAEVAYLDNGSADGDISGVPVSVESSGVELSATASIATNEWFSVFARGGVLFWDGKLNTAVAGTVASDGADPIVGAGMSFALGSLSLRAEYEYCQTADVDGQILTLAFVRKF